LLLIVVLLSLRALPIENKCGFLRNKQLLLPLLMVNTLAIISICVCVIAIAISVWFFIETKGLRWPHKKDKKKSSSHKGYY